MARPRILRPRSDISGGFSPILSPSGGPRDSGSIPIRIKPSGGPKDRGAVPVRPTSITSGGPAGGASIAARTGIGNVVDNPFFSEPVQTTEARVRTTNPLNSANDFFNSFGIVPLALLALGAILILRK